VAPREPALSRGERFSLFTRKVGTLKTLQTRSSVTLDNVALPMVRATTQNFSTKTTGAPHSLDPTQRFELIQESVQQSESSRTVITHPIRQLEGGITPQNIVPVSFCNAGNAYVSSLYC